MDLQVYRHLYGVSGIPLCIVENGTVLLALPEQETDVFTPRFLDLCCTDYEVYAQSHTGPLLMMLNPGYYLAVARLDGARILVLGPGVLAQFAWSELLPWMKAPLFADNHSAMGRLLMSQTPTTATQFFYTLSMALYLATGELLDPDTFSPFDAEFLHYRVQPSLTQYMFDARESEGFHTPYSREAQMTRAVETGNLEQLKRLRLHRVSGRLGVLSLNRDRQMRYMFVTVVALFSRAALWGGLHYEKAYSMADIYCQRMDAMTNPADIEQLQSQVIEDYCREVAALKKEQYSPTVRRCCTYIQQHTHEKITLEMLADQCGMSGRRLSEKFKKETGSSVVDYIHRVKMEEAELLLRDSDYTLGEISSYLGYANQSHFIAVFRRLYGMTPMQYRNRCR